jgi:hypothetical protein
MRNPSQLNAEIAVVRLGGQDVFLAPGTPMAPFGTLPWNETVVSGPAPQRLGRRVGDDAAPSRHPRHAWSARRQLRLTPDEGLEGTVTFTFTGLDALARRLEERNEDETERRRALEDEVKADMTDGGSEVTLTEYAGLVRRRCAAGRDFRGQGAWMGAHGRLARTGSRRHIRRGESACFRACDAHYMPCISTFLHQLEDEVSVDLPPGWTVSSVPRRAAPT